MNATARRRPPAEQKTSDTQRQQVAKGLHADIDTVVHAWPQIQTMAYTMGAGYPSKPPDGAPARLLTEDELENGVVALTVVERLASDNRPDDGEKAVEWFAHLTETLGHIRNLASEAATLTWTPKPDGEGEPGCIVHRMHGHYETVYANMRCRWCYDFWTAEKLDPPGTLIKARSEGRRITDHMVRTVLGKSRFSRR